jgi:hypothetical protein
MSRIAAGNDRSVAQRGKYLPAGRRVIISLLIDQTRIMRSPLRISDETMLTMVREKSLNGRSPLSAVQNRRDRFVSGLCTA